MVGNGGKILKEVSLQYSHSVSTTAQDVSGSRVIFEPLTSINKDTGMNSKGSLRSQRRT